MMMPGGTGTLIQRSMTTSAGSDYPGRIKLLGPIGAVAQSATFPVPSGCRWVPGCASSRYEEETMSVAKRTERTKGKGDVSSWRPKRRATIAAARLFDRLPARLVERAVGTWERVAPHIPVTPDKGEPGYWCSTADQIGMLVPLLAVLTRGHAIQITKAVEGAILDGTFDGFAPDGGFRIVFAKDADRIAHGDSHDDPLATTGATREHVKRFRESVVDVDRGLIDEALTIFCEEMDALRERGADPAGGDPGAGDAARVKNDRADPRGDADYDRSRWTARPVTIKFKTEPNGVQEEHVQKFIALGRWIGAGAIDTLLLLVEDLKAEIRERAPWAWFERLYETCRERDDEDAADYWKRGGGDEPAPT